ncbi:MAG: rhomboid family intramembrane serine protease [Prevotellaceae bacterium]|jgi:membrane associated rhomboid family serine protease|nr:rhomboid family intramembrane serine protease [Prevotellaceae bacterium]
MITLIIVIVTCIVSITAFQRRDLFEKLLLSPYRVANNKEWYRMITHGFLHGDYIHLAVNMIVLYSFGEALQDLFSSYSAYGAIHFALLYFGALIVASFSTVIKYKDSYSYASIGASGAVSAVLFAFVFINPWSKLHFMGILPIPGIIFGPLYLWYSSYMAKRGGDNVNHDAHFYGAVFGFIYPVLVNPYLLQHFIRQLVTFGK